jgi:hypothetical protein
LSGACSCARGWFYWHFVGFFLLAAATFSLAEVGPALTQLAKLAPALTKLAELAPALTKLAELAPALTVVANDVKPERLQREAVIEAAETLSDADKNSLCKDLPQRFFVHRLGNDFEISKHVNIVEGRVLPCISPPPIASGGGAGKSASPRAESPLAASPSGGTASPSVSKSGVSAFVFVGQHEQSMHKAAHDYARLRVSGSSEKPCLVAGPKQREGLALVFKVDKTWVSDGGKPLVAHVSINPSREMPRDEFEELLKQAFAAPCFVLRGAGSKPEEPRSPDWKMVKPVPSWPSTGDPVNKSPDIRQQTPPTPVSLFRHDHEVTAFVRMV